MAKWIEKANKMFINLEDAREQYKTLGYPHRKMLYLQCDACNKITTVDDTIMYQYCPHCGVKIDGMKEGD